MPPAPTNVPKNASEVLPRLWQGGVPKPGRYDLDLIVLAASEYQPTVDKFPGAELLHVPLPDDWRGLTATAREKLYATVVAASREVADWHRAGKRVLVTCGAGLNRSGLITGVALRELGYTADEALALIRRARGPRALAGKAFPRFIRDYQPGDPSFARAATAAAASAAATAAPVPGAAPTPPAPSSPSKGWGAIVVGAVLTGVAVVVIASAADRS